MKRVCWSMRHARYELLLFNFQNSPLRETFIPLETRIRKSTDAKTLSRTPQ